MSVDWIISIYHKFASLPLLDMKGHCTKASWVTIITKLRVTPPPPSFNKQQRQCLMPLLCVAKGFGRGGIKGATAYQFSKQQKQNFINKRTIKVCVSCSWWCLGTTTPCHPWRCHWISVVPEAWHAAWRLSPWRTPCQLKKTLQGTRTRDLLGSCMIKLGSSCKIKVFPLGPTNIWFLVSSLVWPKAGLIT